MSAAGQTSAGPPDEAGARSFWIAIALLTLLGVALRLLYLRQFGQPLPTFSDAHGYYQMGRNLAEGHGFVAWFAQTSRGVSIPSAAYPPLYPALLALLRLVGLDSVGSQRAVVAALGAVNVPLLALAGRRLSGPLAGGTAAALATVSPALIEIDGSFMTEGLYLTFVSVALLAILHAETRPGWLAWGGVGALLGLATLTRSEGFILLGLLLPPIAWRLGRGQPLLRRLVPLLAAGLGLALVVAPWTARNAVRIGELVPVSQSYKGVLVGANCQLAYQDPDELGGWVLPCVRAVKGRGLSEAERFARYRAVGLRYALAHRKQWPHVVRARILRTWGLFRPGEWFGLGPPEIRSFAFARRTMWTGWLLIALAPLGLALLARRSFVHFWLLLAPILTVTFTSTIAYGNPRFRAAAEPSLILLAAVVVEASCRTILGSVRARASRDRGPRPAARAISPATPPTDRCRSLGARGMLGPP